MIPVSTMTADSETSQASLGGGHDDYHMGAADDDNVESSQVQEVPTEEVQEVEQVSERHGILDAQASQGRGVVLTEILNEGCGGQGELHVSVLDEQSLTVEGHHLELGTVFHQHAIARHLTN